MISRELRPGSEESLKRFGAVLLKVEKDLGESFGAHLLKKAGSSSYILARMFSAGRIPSG